MTYTRQELLSHLAKMLAHEIELSPYIESNDNYRFIDANTINAMDDAALMSFIDEKMRGINEQQTLVIDRLVRERDVLTLEIALSK